MRYQSEVDLHWEKFQAAFQVIIVPAPVKIFTREVKVKGPMSRDFPSLFRFKHFICAPNGNSVAYLLSGRYLIAMRDST